MDVSPCNPLLDLRFVALVLSRTLNGSSEGQAVSEEMNRPAALPAFLLIRNQIHQIGGTLALHLMQLLLL
jgi:hypothetical protein